MDALNKNRVFRLTDSNEEGEGFAYDLRKLKALGRYKWGILSLAFFVTLLVALVVFNIRPIYRATTTLLIESKAAKVVSIEEVYGVDTTNSDYYMTEYEVLKSRSLAEKVIAKLNLKEDKEFNNTSSLKFSTENLMWWPSKDLLNWRKWLGLPEVYEEDVLSPDQRHTQQVVNLFLERLTISPIRKTQLVKISFDAHDKVLAAKIADAVAEAYIEGNLQARLDANMQASSWLMAQMNGLRDKLRSSEQRLQEYRDAENIVGEKGGFDIATNELDLIANKLVDARRERMQLQARHDQIQSIGISNPSRLELVPGVLQHPIVQSQKQAVLQIELKRSELAKRYGDKHPMMQSANAELANAKSSLNRQIVSVINGYENEYKAALANEQSLQSSLDKSKGNIQGLKRKEYRLNELEKEVETNRKLYDTFFTRFNETNATEDLKAVNARITDGAEIPMQPSKPRKGLILSLSFFIGIFVGTVLAFLAESLNNTYKHASDIRNKIGLTVLGVLPLLSKKRSLNPSYTAYLGKDEPVFSEAVRTIRTGIVLSSIDDPYKTMLVTSTVPGEGKTSMALNLAYSLGQLEKVLLVDADMRRPSVAKSFGIDGRAHGLSSVIAGMAKLDDVIVKDEASGVDILCAGIVPANPLELLSSNAFSKLLDSLKDKYDRIILDTAPILAVSDALALAKQVDGLIYVIKADSTKDAQVRQSMIRLHEINANVVGVVLNQVDLKKQSKYYGSEYGGYYDAYGYTQAG
ncbi:hypothetical protein C4K68_23620 [Pokkaliibacter plantistimulans]|uniref:non-specific protein-tyrosine kinase n=1 Tax=Proteobacteria bacterium 228 TaxID=2083153 RepID=A0A2S5KJG8_9PROT|nr:polysaccharide biosynthesis tyrosine autokinase [Pokkaliibacter plantistimulans]PPC74964.1 hypothetical protein C4K68_23620 [Pokkaliibacter plantistimulans]